MNKLYGGLIILLLLAALVSWPALAQEPPDLSAIDSEVAGWLPDVQDYQDNYFLLNGGNYYQMLWSHVETPDHLTPVEPDYLGTGPHDQAETGYNLWFTAGLPVSTTYRIKTDTYRGLTGPGWVLVLQTQYSGQVWQRAINQGPASYLSYDWHYIPEEE